MTPPESLRAIPLSRFVAQCERGGRTRWPGKAGSMGALAWRRNGFIGCGDATHSGTPEISAQSKKHDDPA